MSFQLDEKVTVRSILIALRQEGVTVAQIAKQIDGISEKPLRNALKKAGYVYSNSDVKGWYFAGEGEKPLDKSIFDFVEKRSSSTVKKNSPKVIDSNTTNVVKGNTEFTQDEIKMIREMLKSWQQTAPTVQENEQKEFTLYERVKQLPQNEKTRKTIVLDKDIGNRLDQLCKTEKFNKSDILHLALMDLLDKYE